MAAVRLAPEHVAAPLKAADLSSQHRFAYLVSKEGIVLANSISPNLNYRVLGTLDPTQTQIVKQQYALDRVDSMGLTTSAMRSPGPTRPGSRGPRYSAPKRPT